MSSSIAPPSISFTHAAILFAEQQQLLINRDSDFINELWLCLKNGIEMLSTNCLDEEGAESLLDTIAMLAYLKEPDVFLFLLKLFSFDEGDLEDQLGECFITEDLPFLLAATAKGRWSELRKHSDNIDCSETMRIAACEAMRWMVVDGQLERKELIEYFKASFQEAIEIGTVDSIDELINCKVWLSTDLWPGECLEEIKTLFGWGLLDGSTDISSVLTAFNSGIDSCLDRLREQWKNHRFIRDIEENEAYIRNLQKILSDLKKSEEINQKIEQFEQSIWERHYADKRGPARNDPCKCGSGKKYKKCCINEVAEIETYTITSEPIDKEFSLPDYETPSLFDLHHGCRNQPAVYLEHIKRLLVKYPNVDALHNYLYIAYRILGENRQAHQVLLETHERFPDYLFALVELGMINLRRGEPERALEMLGGCHTLKELYPLRHEFHISEAIAFSYFMACYYVDVGQASKAIKHLELIEKVAERDKAEAVDIRKRIKDYAAQQVYEKRKI